MHDRPDAATLLDMVAELLRTTVLPRLDGAVAYQTRIAANLVTIAAREFRAAPMDDAAELASLRMLLDHDGDLHALNVELARRIADKALTLEDPAVADHLWRVALGKLAVDQPHFPRLQEYT